MEPKHSTWSASGFEQKILCPGSHILQRGLQGEASFYAADGTGAHQVLTWALQSGTDAAAYIGRVMDIDGHSIVVDEEMVQAVQVCIDYVRDVAGLDGVVLVDQRVNYADSLGVERDQAWGTADVIILLGDEIIVVDYKHGRGVPVEAERNPQMSLYALGALEAYGVFTDFVRARLVISQPRARTAPSEWDTSVEELVSWARTTARSAIAACTAAENDVESFLRPGERQCRFCRAKATCPALRAEVAYITNIDAASPEEFATSEPLHPNPDNAEWLAACLSRVDLIEDWCKSIRAEAERRLQAGVEVPGWKLVQGKRGARQWSDPAAAEELLRRTFRLTIEQAYDLKLISPTTAEKLKKAGTIGERQWARVQELITQSEGRAHVAPASDPRPAIVVAPVVDEFSDLTIA